MSGRKKADLRRLVAGLRLPMVAAPMFLVSDPGLVVAACRSGIIGALPSLNRRSSEELDEWLVEIGESLGGCPNDSYGVNLIVHRSNVRLDQDLAVCVRRRVPIVFTSLGAVPDVVAAVHGYGGYVMHDVTLPRHAEKALEAGVDGLVLVGAGAGGRAGTLNPFALLGEVRRFYDGPLALAGGIGRGEDVAAVIAAGADLAYVGTRFIAAHESGASDDYKRLLVDAQAADILFIPDETGVRGNFLRQSLEAAGVDTAGEAPMPRPINWEEPRRGAWKEVRSAGHGVGAIRSVVAVEDLVREFEQGFAEGRARLAGSLAAGRLAAE